MTQAPAPSESTSTSVHPEERAVEHADTACPTMHERRATVEIEFRHSGWRRTRTRVRDALERVDASRRRLDAFDACGTNAWVLVNRNEPTHYRVAANHCHDRYCQPCATARSATIAANLRKHLHGGQHRFITLTTRHSAAPLAEQLDKLTRSYRRLRQRNIWRNAVTAAIAFIEIKRNAARNRWHPHLHVIARSQWIQQQELRDAWHTCTGDSYIVDIRLARGDRVLSYVAKYASKPLNTDYVDDAEALAEAIEAMARRRLIIQSGAWSRIKLTEKPNEGDWLPMAPLHRIIDRAKRGDADAAAIIEALTRSTACNRAPPPNNPPDHSPPR